MALTLLPPKGQGQVMAVGLLLVTAVLFYYLCIHWFVRGHIDVATQMQELKELDLRFRQELSKRKAIDQRQAEVDQFNANNAYSLSDKTFDKGAATLTSKIKAAVQTHGDPDRCGQPTVLPQNLGSKEPYEKVSTQVQLRCDLDDSVRILYALETSQPFLFVSELNLYQQPIMDSGIVNGGGMGNMSIRFDLSAYLGKSMDEAKPDEAKGDKGASP